MRERDAITLLMALITIGGFVLILWSLNLRYRRRELEHKERMAAIQAGSALPALTHEPPAWGPRFYLLRGMVWLFTGIAIVIFVATAAATTRRPLSLEYTLGAAQRLRAQGANEAQVQQFMNENRYEGVNPAAALIGCIPMAVGVAYLIFYRVESRNAGVGIKRVEHEQV